LFVDEIELSMDGEECSPLPLAVVGFGWVVVGALMGVAVGDVATTYFGN
jgi:uncharacterized integral membrane protein